MVVWFLLVSVDVAIIRSLIEILVLVNIHGIRNYLPNCFISFTAVSASFVPAAGVKVEKPAS